MVKHSYIIGGILLFGLAAAIIILLTVPTNPAATPAGGGQAVSTTTLDRSDTVKGLSSLDGQIIFSRQGALWRWRGDSAARLALDTGKSLIANYSIKLLHPALSRDGTKLAFVREDETFSDLWISSADGSGAKALTDNKGSGTPRSPAFTGSALWAYSPNWSPDGTELAFLSDVGTDDLTLWVSDPVRFNRKAISKLALGTGGMQRPSWSATGDALVVAAFENGKSQIYTVKASSGEPGRLTELPEGAYDPVWSPDGKFIAYVARRGSSSELWIIKADGSSPQLLTNQPSRTPVWSPDSKKLAFLSLKDGGFELFTLEISAIGSASGGPKQISQGAKLDGSAGLSWSR